MSSLDTSKRTFPIRSLGCVTVLSAALILSACTASPSPDPTQAAPADVGTSVPPISERFVDFPFHRTLDELIGASEQSFEGTVIDSRGEWSEPVYTSTDPFINPYAGTGETPSPEEVREAAVPVTLSSVKVEAPLASKFTKGQIVQVQSLGGVVDGTDYRFGEAVRLAADVTYAFFINEAIEGGVYPLASADVGALTKAADGTYGSHERIKVSEKDVQKLSMRSAYGTRSKG